MSTSESRINLKVFSTKQKTFFVVLLVVAFILGVGLPIVLGSNMLFSIRTSRTYLQNELSDEDLISPISFSFIDKVETERLRAEASDRIPPYFSFSYAETIKMREISEDIYRKGQSPDLLEILEEENTSSYLFILSKLGEEKGAVATVSRECINYFLSEGVFRQEDINQAIQNGWNLAHVEGSNDFPMRVENREVDVHGLFTDSNLRAKIYEWILTNYDFLSYEEIQTVTNICELVIKPNVIFDEIYTEAEKDFARNSVEPVVVNVEKGDYILKTDTIVSSSALLKLEYLNAERSLNINWFSLLSRIIIVLFILFFWFWFQEGLISYSYRKAQYSIIVLVMYLFTMVGGFIIVWYLYSRGITNIEGFLPFFIIGMIATSITSSRSYGTATLLLVCSSYLLWPTANIYSFFYLLSCGSAINLSIKKNNGRFSVIMICFKCVLYDVGLTVVWALLEGTGFMMSLVNIASIGANVVISFIIYSIVLPILDNVFNIPTKQRLHELAYTDNAMLTKLSKVAQGTYNHVKTVAELAQAGCEAVGANAELAFVGARYHDLGKMVHPEYFVENQQGKNAHDNISSQLSGSVIKSHVRLGVEMGKEIGLPQEVLDIISQHHGNDIIRYFFNEAVKNANERTPVVKEDFMYDGDIPSTKESAIVMLADCVEAATKTIKNPNHQRYERFINNIFTDKYKNNQLDNSGLTMNDLMLIKEAFIPALMGRDHHRIEYNNDKD